MQEKQTGVCRTEQKRESLIFWIILIACGWFFSVGGWNQVSRYDAVFAFWENPEPNRFTWIIDQYMYCPEKGINTGDWAYSECNGHYYSNKSPGTAVFGTLFYGPLYHIEKCFVRGKFSPGLDLFNAWILNILLSGIPLAFGAVFFRRLLLRHGLSGLRADIFTLLMVFGTGMWPYSTQLWALPAVGAFLVMAYYFYTSDNRRSGPWLAGIFFGMAVLWDYTAGVLIPAVGIAILWDVIREKRMEKLWRFICGGLPFAIFYLIYNQVQFGGPFEFAFLHNNAAFVDQARTGGIAAFPNVHVILELLFGQYRGLFPAMPFLLFAVPGFLFFRRQGKEKRLTGLFFAACILFILLMNASFNGWHGGDAALPRYLIPSFPIWCFLTAFAPLKRLRTRAVFAGFAILSICNMTALTAGTPLESGSRDKAPVYRSAYRNLCRADMGYCSDTLKDACCSPDVAKICKASTTSVGENLGLPRYASTGCLFLLLLACIGVFLKSNNGAGIFLTYESERWKNALSKNIFRVNTVSLLLLFGCILLLLLPGDIFFINDEPHFVGNAWQLNQSNQFATHAPCELYGNSGFTYGPGAVLLYQMLMLLIPHDLILLAVLKTGLSLAAILFAFHQIFRSRENKTAGYFTLFFLLFSPYFYLYVRSLWDNVFLLPLSALVMMTAYQYWETGKRSSVCLCAGLLLAGLFIHPMAVSLAIAFGIYLLLFRSDLVRKHIFLLAGLVISAVLLFGAFLLWHQDPHGGAQLTAFSMSNILPALNGLSYHNFISYFFPIFSVLNCQSGPARFLLPLCRLSFLLIIFFFLFGVIDVIRRFRSDKKDLLAGLGLFALIAIGIHLLVLSLLIKTCHPHYAMPILIPAAWLCGMGADRLCRRTNGRLFTHAYFLCTAACLVCMIVLIHRNGGGTGIHYGATLSNQLRVVRTIRQKAASYPAIQLQCATRNEQLFPHTLQFLYRFTEQNDLPIRYRGPKYADPLPLCIVYTGSTPCAGFIDAVTPDEYSSMIDTSGKTRKKP